MAKYTFSNILDSFIVNEQGKILGKSNEKIQKPLTPEILNQVLSNFRDPKYLKAFREKNLALTKQKIKKSVNEDNFICQAINSIQETDKIINTLSKRLREWYSLTNPEFSKSLSNNEKFAELIQKKSKTQLLKEIHAKDSMGADLPKTDLDTIFNLARQVTTLSQYRQDTLKYLENLMERYCRNLNVICGTTIAAKLLEHTGSLKKLAILPASTVQVLGAEKALFRHLKTGARAPRHGLIVEHPLLSSAPQKEHGKRARALATKISLAAKLDYFKGRFMADQMKKDLEQRFK